MRGVGSPPVFRPLPDLVVESDQEEGVTRLRVGWALIGLGTVPAPSAAAPVG